MKYFQIKNITILLMLLIGTSALAQKKMLTYEQAYKNAGPKLYGSLPSIRGWISDNEYLESFRDGGARLMKVNASNGNAELFLDYVTLNKDLDEGFSLQRASGNTSDYQRFFFLKEGNLFFYDRAEAIFRQITNNESADMNPGMSPDGNFIAFTRNRDLYMVNTQTGEETRFTNDAGENVYNGWSSWVYFEEILGRRTGHQAFWWSPDSKKLAYMRFDDTNVPVFPIYIADGQHGELEKEHYPKPGDPNPDARLAVIEITSANTTWMEYEADNDQYIAWPFFTPDSKQMIYQWMNRGQDHIKLLLGDLSTGKSTIIHEEKQNTWVEFYEDLYILKDNNGIIVRSNVSGWSHLYHYSMDGNLVKQITSGEWPVKRINKIDEKSKKIYFSGFQKHSTDYQLFVVDFSGKNLKQLTQGRGSHFVTVSSNGSFFYDRFSNIETPSKMDLYNNKGQIVRDLGTTDTGVHHEYALGKTELFTYSSGDGYDLPGVWVLPPGFDENRKYPVIISVYGGPGAGMVRNMYRRNSDQFLAENGIIVMSIDLRASGHFGKVGVAQMHRNLGKWEMHDYIAAVKRLRTLNFIDPDRIGITGGSYGGYMTTMALTYGADYFTHGIAHAPCNRLEVIRYCLH